MTVFESLENPPENGWVLYDADCSFCLQMLACIQPLLERKDVRPLPLQSPWARTRLGLTEESDLPVLLREMRVITPEDQVYGGAKAVLYLAGLFWWAWPLVVFGHLPGGLFLMDAAYRYVARRRHCASGHCSPKR